MPLKNNLLTPGLIGRACKRGNLASRVSKQALDRLNKALLPAILILKDTQACVLLDLDPAKGVAGVVYPELGEARIEVPVTELHNQFGGYIIYIKPKFRFDARSPEGKTVRRRHWFWSVMGDNLALYRDVLIAAFFLSLFALAMPLFIRNVYDRVIPNLAIPTLWALAAGVVLALFVELLLRVLRSNLVDGTGRRVGNCHHKHR